MNKALSEYLDYIRGKDYAGLSDETLLDILTPYLAQNKKLRNMLNDYEEFESLRRNKQIALAAKKVREHLRKVYGSYHTKQSKKARFLLKDLKKAIEEKGYANTQEEHHELIKAHRSTKERADFIAEFYEKIFDETGLPSSIADIACGLNPLTAFWMAEHEMIPAITGYEISDWEVEIINEYAKIAGLDITAQRCDLNLKIPQIRADCLFAFKFFELISTKRVEQIVTSAQVNWIVASYPTKTLKREKMAKTTRAWFHLLLKRLEYPYKLLHFENEIVYVIKKP